MYKENTHIKEIIDQHKTPYYVLMSKLGCSQAQALRLKHGNYVPNMENLLKLAQMYNTNVSYLLDRTECGAPCSTYEPNNRLQAVLKERKITSKIFAATVDVGDNAFLNFVSDPAYIGRTETWRKMSDALDLSIDYLMGLTNEIHWEPLADYSARFPVAPGWAGYMDGPVYEGPFLVSPDGWWLIFPDGTKAPITAYKYLFSKIVELVHPKEEKKHE